MLKVEFVRYRDALCATILEQGDEIERGKFCFSYRDFDLTSDDCPAIIDTVLFLRGRNKKLDNKKLFYQYDTEEKAKEALQSFKAAIEAYNASLSTERPKTPDIETMVVG